MIVLSQLLFGDCFCYIAIAVSLSRCLDGGFSMATAIVVLSLHFCIAIVIVNCCIAIAKERSPELYRDRNCSIAIIA